MSTTEESLDAGTVGEPTVAESDRREAPAAPTSRRSTAYRAIAALMVVLTHVATSSGVAITGGVVGHVLARLDFGVPLFFLMSGFLLYRPWVRTGLEGRARPGLGRTRCAGPRASRRCTGSSWWSPWRCCRRSSRSRPAVGHPPGRAADLHLDGRPRGSEPDVEPVHRDLLLRRAAARRSAGHGAAEPLAERRWRRQLVVLGLLVAVSLVYNVVPASPTLPAQAGFWLPPTSTGSPPACCWRWSRSAPAGSPTRLVQLVMTLGRDQATCLILFASLFVIALTPVAAPPRLQPHRAVGSRSSSTGSTWARRSSAAAGHRRAGGAWLGEALTAPVPHALGLISWHLPLAPRAAAPCWRTGSTSRTSRASSGCSRPAPSA